MHRQNKNRKLWFARPDFLDQLDTAAILERDIHNRNIRLHLIKSRERLLKIFGFATDGEVGLFVDELTESLADNRMVINE